VTAADGIAEIDGIRKVGNGTYTAKGAQMTKDSDCLINPDKAHLETFSILDSTVTKNILEIVAEATDYSKKSLDDRLAFVEKLLGAKSFDTAIQIESEYAKTSFEGFVAEATKMGELYSNLAKLAFVNLRGGRASPRSETPR
jgi:hypothetical protein